MRTGSPRKINFSPCVLVCFSCAVGSSVSESSNCCLCLNFCRSGYAQHISLKLFSVRCFLQTRWSTGRKKLIVTNVEWHLTIDLVAKHAMTLDVRAFTKLRDWSCPLHSKMKIVFQVVATPTKNSGSEYSRNSRITKTMLCGMRHVFALWEEDKLQDWEAEEFLHCDLSYADIVNRIS